MKRLLTLTTCMTMFAGAALASGTHGGGHGDEAAVDNGHHGKMMIGEPGKAGDVNRKIKIVMKETAGGEMLFKPSMVSFEAGQTIQFSIKNVGKLDHEFVLDEHHALMEHKKAMEKFPEMEHDDPNSVRLEPGEKGEIIWKFSNAGEFEFGCLIPGHYDAGMKGAIKISGKVAGS